jgi:phosphoglycerate dehydrogenase-like enzyme
MDDHTLIVIADPSEPELALLEELPPKTILAVGNKAEALENAAPQATAILNWAFSNATLREILPRCSRLRWIHSRAAGLDTFLFPELVDSPALLTNGSGVFSQSLGEFVLGAILYFAKDFRRMIRNQEAGAWAPFDVLEISRQTVGIVGYGDIGRAAASRARAMGMRVLALRRRSPVYNDDPLADQMFGPENRMEMLSRSDYLVVAAPLTPDTRGMIGAAEIAAMKPDAVLINVGRGPVVDEAALVDALSRKRIKGAALDVFEHEPLPQGHPFYKLENVLLSPHCADHTPTWTVDAMRFFLEQFERFRNGEAPRNVVEKRLGY